MTLDEFKKRQKASLVEFKRLARSDAPKAAECAMNRLRAAKIVDKDGNLAKPYR